MNKSSLREAILPSALLLAVTFTFAACDKAKPHAESAQPSPSQLSFDQLVEKTSCMGCHASDNQMALPDWKQVAEKYRGQSDAVRMLKAKIARGGSGVWGRMDMPPYPELSDYELDVLARGILAAPSHR